MTYLPHTYDEIDQLCANTLRTLSIDAVQAANSGHPGLPLGVADIVTVLWTRFLKHHPNHPDWPNRDRFVLSPGHGSALLYSLLHVHGYPLSLEDLKNFRQWGSLTPGHPEYDRDLGIEATTGPLGQGLGNAVGMAMAERWLAERFNHPGFDLIDHNTYAIVGDGDLMEGISHETASLAGHLGLGKLIVLFDDNHISIDGDTSITTSDDTLSRFHAYGWHTQHVDGHDMAAIDTAIQTAQQDRERPSLIACRTHIGFGSPEQDTSKVHGTPLGNDGVHATKEKLGTLENKFYVPVEAQARFNQVKIAGADYHTNWNTLLEKYRTAYPELAILWDQYTSGQLPPNWIDALPDFSNAKAMATRATSGLVLDSIAPQLPFLLGGSADLSGSNKTKPQGARGLSREDFSGNYIYYGIREHGMGAIMNGLALHGLRPYGGTFLVFSDYVRPAIRVGALMKQPVIYVFTHDSIGLGEDGPTHQPVEHLTALRTIPNLVTLRPADGNETSQAWKFALERTEGPTALALSRQALPQITPFNNGLSQGAYTLKDAANRAPLVVLIASGSEVSLALKAQTALAVQGIASRVVSMPSWELFEAQSKDYKISLFPPGIARLAIESGISLAWPRYADATIGIDKFGTSAPAEIIFENYGFTVENVVKQAKMLLQA
jgi:transketolase